MPILVALIALFLPRLTILGLWLFTPWFEGVFKTALWPILGFIFLPLTTLWYSVVVNWFAGEWNVLAIVGLVAAILLDASPARFRRRRTVVEET